LIRLRMGRLGAVGLRVDDHVGEEQIAVAGVAIIIGQRRRALAIMAFE
jgi:hypothetical protein